MEIKSLIKSTPFRVFNTLFWFTAFLFSLLKQYKLIGLLGIQDLIFWPGAYFLMLALLSPVVFALFLNTVKASLNRFIKTHILYSIVFGTVHFILSGITILLLERLFGFPEHYTFTELLYHYKQQWVLLFEGAIWYLIIIVILSVLHYHQRYLDQLKKISAVKSDLTSSNLQVLSTQLNPHFLFNAMNSITMMVRRNENKKAVSMIAALSDMLRMAMAKHQNQLVSLQNEVEILDKYLILEQERFKDRVEVRTSFPEETLSASVPKLVLQPLVENAFKHGVNNIQEKALIEVNSEKAGEQLLLSVYNSGETTIDWDINNANSLGLPNTIHRLRQLYESDFGFKVIEKGNGVLFQISLPFVNI